MWGRKGICCRAAYPRPAWQYEQRAGGCIYTREGMATYPIIHVNSAGKRLLIYYVSTALTNFSRVPSIYALHTKKMVDKPRCLTGSPSRMVALYMARLKTHSLQFSTLKS